MSAARQWFGARRIVLKARYAGAQARARLGTMLSTEPRSVPLHEVQRRLEIVLAAAYGRPIPVSAIEERGWRKRLRGALPFLRQEESPTIEGDAIKLPARLPVDAGHASAVDRYRLFAIEQAERITRGTMDHVVIRDPLERDLYLLREAAAIDARIARSFPGMHAVMEEDRRAALRHRPKADGLTPTERGVEDLLVRTLNTPANELDAADEDPQASLAWAKQTASEIRARGGRYRGVPLATAWGSVTVSAEDQPPAYNQPQSLLPGRSPSGGTEQDSSAHAQAPDKHAKGENTESDEDGTASDKGAAADKSEAPPDAKHSEAGQSETAPNDTSAGSPSTLDASGSPQNVRDESTANLPRPIYYDEWNSERGVYVRSGAAVRLYTAEEGNSVWLHEQLKQHAATARQIRHQFERLRARRSLLMRQQRGDMLDLNACVESIVARRMGDAPDDRLYVDARPARRGIAIALLIDVSGSTNGRVTEAWRIIDIEKIALSLASQALDALGDLYAIYAFAGRQASNVKVTVVKDFPESNGENVTRRIAGLAPEGNTRLGAAIRHATRELARQTAGHRLLLLLSDGRPNDVDGYQGPYGVEDSRQAILEARASGVFPYCLTIDQSASEYLPRMFGKAGHVVLDRPEQLPKALLTVVQGLIKR